MERFCVSKGGHSFQLWGAVPVAPAIRKNIQRVEWLVRFDRNCAYELLGADRKDWNKGGGVSFATSVLSKEMLDNHTDAAMWGWRYNPHTGLVELTAYCHIDGKRPFLKYNPYAGAKGLKDGEVCLEVGFNQAAKIVLEVDWKNKTYRFTFHVHSTTAKYPVGVAFNHGKRWGRLIGLWFGGNNSAPQKMDVFLSRHIE